LLNWTADNAASLSLAEPKPKAKRTMLPILTVLFLVSYGLMALLVVEQGRTIENQRYLIMSLFDDSNQLSHLKGKALPQRGEAQAQASTKDHSRSQAQTPSTQNPSTQTPSTQAAPGAKAKTSPGASKLRKQLEKPPVGADDNGDLRRSLLKI